MKTCKFILPLAFSLLFSITAFCKTATDTSTIDGLYSYIFATLDKTQIPTGYLEEYGAPILPLAPYNGVLSTGNNISMTMWRTLYWQINTAYTGTGNQQLCFAGYYERVSKKQPYRWRANAGSCIICQLQQCKE